MIPKSILFILLACFLSISSASENIETDQDVWAFADIHGAYDEFVKLLKTAELIDEQLDWSGGKAHLISTGDVLDRGPHPRKTFDLMMKIEKQAEAAGGGFHFLLGNHEVMVLTGDLRYVADAEYLEFAADENDKMREHYFRLYQQYHQRSEPVSVAKESKNIQDKNTEKVSVKLTSEQLRAQFDKEHLPGFFARYEAFLPEGKYGKWLLQKQVIQKVNGDVFTHGGLSPTLINRTFVGLQNELTKTLSDYIKDWTQLVKNSHLPVASHFKKRAGFIRGISTEKVAEFQQHYQKLLFTSQSPTWYRGDAYCHPYYENQALTGLLENFKANRLFVGHTTTNSNQVEIRLNGRVYLMDTGMLKMVYGGHGNILKITSDSVAVLDTKGQSYAGIDGIHHPSFYPDDYTLPELEKVLSSAPISKMEQLNTGITRPIRLTFADSQSPADGKKRTRVRAIFKNINSNRNLEYKRQKNSKDENYADRYHFEIAAYRLSELLGFNMVPMATNRTIQEVEGAAQFWVEDSYSEYTAEQKGWEYKGYCSRDEQVNMMKIFDLLIYNKDRNNTNILVEQGYEQLVWIDHSRAFSSHSVLPVNVNKIDIKLTPDVKKALESLNRSNLKKIMKGLLNQDQIRSILKRRNRILKLAKD